MGALFAVLQNDPNLLRCQLARLDKSVSLADGDGGPPDAYGFGHYSGGSVLLGKRPSGVTAALSLADLVGKVDSEALLVQARHAVFGQAKDENTQPFRFRRWLFAHDGTIERFDLVKPKLVAALPDFLRRQIMGDTDSEHAFMVFLKILKEEGRLDDLDLDAGLAARALARTVRQLETWRREVGEQKPCRLTFAGTDRFVLDHEDLCSYGYGRSFGDQDLGHHARGRRGHLGVDLVGRYLEERLVELDTLALLLQPLEDRSLDDRLAELRHLDRSHAPSRIAVTTRKAYRRLLRCRSRPGGKRPRAPVRTGPERWAARAS